MDECHSFDQIIDWIEAHSKRPLLVGIDGFGGSGKSTLAKRLAGKLHYSEVISYDDLWLPASIQPNYLTSPTGIVEAYDWQALKNDAIQPFLRCQPVRYPVLDWVNQTRSVGSIDGQTKILIIEGISCTMLEVRELYDLRVWVSAPYELRLARGIHRDGEAMRNQWVDDWMPAEQIYFNSSRPDRAAHFHVDGTG